jgi:hypothetical protein
MLQSRTDEAYLGISIAGRDDYSAQRVDFDLICAFF